MARELIPYPQTLCDAMAEELTRVLGSRSGRPGRATRVESAEPIAWIVPVRLDGRAVGTVTLGVTADGARALAAAEAAALGHDHPTGEHAVMTALHAVMVEVAGALGERSICEGLSCSAGTARRAEPGASLPDGGHYRLEFDDGSALTVRVWASLDAMSRGEAAPRPVAGASSVPPVAANLDVVLDIDLPLTVRFGETDMTLDALTRIGPGTIVDLGRSPDDPVDVLVNGRLVARGTVVVVGGNYGVRVTEVVSASDRIRSLGA
jgi:flagellar motor switch protein FliN/FliY